MSLRTGTLRVGRAIRIIGIGLACLIWIGGAWFIVTTNMPAGDYLYMLTLVAIIGVIPYGIGRGFAWVIEGFAPEP